jgi:hypothetical protein
VGDFSEEAGAIKVTLQASTGAKILVWHHGDMFHAELARRPLRARMVGVREPQVCLAIDLFEVIADLAALDLEREEEAEEAVELANDAQRRLLAAHP